MKLKGLLLLLMMVPIMLFGQGEGVLSGKVSDEKGKGIEFVNIAVMGSTIGVSSDARGYYKLSLPSDTTLTIVFLLLASNRLKNK